MQTTAQGIGITRNTIFIGDYMEVSGNDSEEQTRTFIAQGPELIQNSAFDIGLEHWQTEGNVTWQNNQYGQFVSIGNGGTVYQRIETVAEAGIYQLALDCMTPHPYRKGRLFYLLESTDGSSASEIDIVCPKNFTWLTSNYQFLITAGEVYTLSISYDWSDSGIALNVDNIYVTKIMDADNLDTGLLENGDFLGSEGWEYDEYAIPRLDYGTIITRLGAVMLTEPYGSITQTFSVLVADEYRLSLDCKTLHGTHSAHFIFVLDSPALSGPITEGETGCGENNWSHWVYTYSLPSNLVYTITLEYDWGTDSPDVIFDNIILASTDSPPPPLPPDEVVVKRYFAGGQQVATRVDGELFYHLNDPSGTSLTMTDAEGETAWQVVYDGYGAVLTGTMPVTLTQTLLDMPDGTTGLVHLGNGRYYDPALGRPLQPNPAGVPPTVPQALNRYAATSLGQPGVFQSTQSSLVTQLLQSSRNQVPGLLAGPPATALAIHLWAETVYKSVPSGFGIVQLEGTVRSLRFLGDNFDRGPVQLANGILGRTLSRLFKGFRLQTATGRMYVGDTTQEFLEVQTRMAQRGITASLLRREFEEIADITATNASREVAKHAGGLLGVVLGGVINVGIQYAYDYDNPYLTGWQKAQRAGVSGIAGGAAGVAGLYAAGLWGGPVGVGFAFTIGVILELEVVPRIFEFVGIIPTRDLHVMTTP